MEGDMAIGGGSVVWLKTGGPRMTAGRMEEGMVTCSWFDNEDKHHEAEFHRDQLTTAKPRDVDEGAWMA